MSHKAIVPASTPTGPLALVITVTATPSLTAHNLHASAPLAHRSASACALGPDDGLLEATVKALRSISPARKRLHSIATKAAQTATLHVTEIPRNTEVRVQIHTNSARLIEAADVLKILPLKDAPDGLPAELWRQLHRFEIVWVKLPDDSAEIATLQRWATAALVPRRAATQDQLTRQEYREVARSYESISSLGEESPEECYRKEKVEDAA